MNPVRDTSAMISGMKPELQPGRYVFCSVPEADPQLVAQALASYKEPEGMSLILPVDVAAQNGLPVQDPMRCITLSVYSALDGVGLTAAAATALAEAEIPCNMVAAYHHDHVFVPESKANEAVAVLVARAAAG